MITMNKDKFINIVKYIDKILVGVLFILLVVFSIGSFIENRNLQQQIEQRDDMIGNLLKKDSVQDIILPSTATEDGSLVYVYRVNRETNKPITYHELDSMYSVLQEELYIKDVVLVTAKRYYKFNYAYKTTGDSIKMKFWSK